MKELIYYPGFEVKDVNWLKFALLYLGHLNPIVPITADNHLSDLYNHLMGETDLIQLHRPNFEEIMTASRDALLEVENILNHPSIYNVEADTIRRWRDPKFHDYELWEEKYLIHWESFCREKGFSSPSSYGMRMPRELALIYMSFLAQAISDRLEVSPITDHSELDSFYISTRRSNHLTRNKVELVKASIALSLPVDIEDIDIKKVIKLRNSAGFKDRQRAFHDQLEVFTKQLENPDNLVAREFLHNLGNPLKEFKDEIITLGTGSIPIGVGAYLLHSATVATNNDITNLTAAGVAFVGTGVISLKNAWRSTRPKRYTRKYVADLGRLS